jgi:hypothetical protein
LITVKKILELAIAPPKALGTHEWTTLFLSMDHKDNIGKYTFIHAVIFVL